ncbi:MAG: hypothetical protein FRX49_08702 [Trebouxia sp. A1-2]|nr:MAG: hypothetical protein FRX49_08702 [Trebouxia sp. A1-2]
MLAIDLQHIRKVSTQQYARMTSHTNACTAELCVAKHSGQTDPEEDRKQSPKAPPTLTFQKEKI